MPQIVPATQAPTHAFSYDVLIRGAKVGKLQTFSPTYNRTLTRVRAVGQSTEGSGETVEIVPSITDYTIAVTNLELYTESILKVVGSSFTTITDLMEPIDIVENIYDTSGATIVATTEYKGCQVNTYSKSGIAANGNVITESVTFWVSQIKKVL